MSDEISFKLTFNKPAQLSYFSNDRGEKFTGLQFKLDETTGDVQIRPVSFQRERNDVAPLSERKRGGAVIVVEGYMAGPILDKLRETATSQKPFFTLTRLGKGWFGVEHYEGVDAPPKIIPHMRLWTPRDDEEADDMPSGEAADFVQKVRAARRVIEDHISERRIGRPPREVAEARDIIANFERVVAELMPERAAPKLDLRALGEAHALIGAVLSSARDGTQMATFVATAEPPTETKASAKADLSPKEDKKPKAEPPAPAEPEPVQESKAAPPAPVSEPPAPPTKAEPKPEPVKATEPKPEPVKATEPKPEPARRTLQAPTRATKQAAPPAEEQEEGLRYEPDPDFQQHQSLNDDEIAEKENLAAQKRLGLLRPPQGSRRRRRFAA